MTIAATVPTDQARPPRRFSAETWAVFSERVTARFGNAFQVGEAIREQHGHTTTWIENESPDAVIFVESTDDVAFVVRSCAELGIPIVPFGVGTSLEGQVNAPEGGVSVDMSRMNKVLAINAEDSDCVVQPGVTRKQLNTMLRDQGLFFPIDPGADATLGGMASTRASGTNAVRYGTMKNMILSMEVVLPDGRIVRTGQRARKSSAGYDLTSLLIGAEGTLGIITELTVRLFGIPEVTDSVIVTFDSVAQANQAVVETIQYGVQVARIEFLDTASVAAINSYSNLNLEEAPLLLVEFHGSQATVDEQMELFKSVVDEHGGKVSPSANSPEERNRIWQGRHDAYWASLQLRPGAKGISTDTCVPISQLANCIEQASDRATEQGIIAPIVGHVGDGNFHTLLLIDQDNPEEVEKAKAYLSWLNELAISVGGTCTGEHGIGQGKAKYLRQEIGDSVDIMVAVKQAIDPQNIMNPGKIFPI